MYLSSYRVPTPQHSLDTLVFQCCLANMDLVMFEEGEAGLAEVDVTQDQLPQSARPDSPLLCNNMARLDEIGGQ